MKSIYSVLLLGVILVSCNAPINRDWNNVEAIQLSDNPPEFIQVWPEPNDSVSLDEFNSREGRIVVEITNYGFDEPGIQAPRWIGDRLSIYIADQFIERESLYGDMGGTEITTIDTETGNTINIAAHRYAFYWKPETLIGEVDIELWVRNNAGELFVFLWGFEVIE
jgi:hypothetical protein